MAVKLHVGDDANQIINFHRFYLLFALTKFTIEKQLNELLNLFTKTGPYDGSATDYSYEGNVAEGLRKLRKKCSSSDGKMVDGLRRSGPGKIHSFRKYNSQHGSFYGCRL